MEPRDRSDDSLPLYRPDILPVHNPEGVRPRDVSEASSHDARIRHLQRVPLFADCTNEELRRIADVSDIVETPAGTVLTRMGAPGDSFYFLIDGRVSVQTAVGGGQPLNPGDFCGEM